MYAALLFNLHLNWLLMAFCRLDRSRSAAGSATRRGYAPRERRDKERGWDRERMHRVTPRIRGTTDREEGGERGGSRWRRDVLLVEQSNTETASRGETPSTALSSRVHRTVATNSSAFLRAPRERVCTVETYQARGETFSWCTRRQGKRFREIGDRGVRAEIERSVLLDFRENLEDCFLLAV